MYLSKIHGWGFESLKACRGLCDDPKMMDILKLHSKYLSSRAMILHQMVGYKILPKARQENDVGLLDVFVMDSMLVGKHFNLEYKYVI